MARSLGWRRVWLACGIASSVLFGLLWSFQGPSRSLVLFAVLLAAVVPVAAWLLRGIDRTPVAQP